jgi:predicted dithiol-disulfide oxidoreductase (DUF899 family)
MSTNENVPHPDIVSRDEWLARRIALLGEEKELTRRRDRLGAERRRLPMVKIEKEYTFDTPDGRKTLLDLFGGSRQLIVYHFMFDPEWDEGCPGCTGWVDSLGDLSLLVERDTAFVLASRSPLAKLRAYQEQRSWQRWTWVSSFGSDFNYDHHVTLDESVAPIFYNYRDRAEREAHGQDPSPKGEASGLSVFFRVGDDVFHAYSSYARGVETATDAYSLLDLTPYGRQEDWEDSPAGWPQRPTYG